jgi:predicted phosphodiesterase
MKILITADLHFRQHWFRWLIEQGASYDLICIAGDLLDMFCGEPRIVQAREVGRWIRELAKVTRVAICSGNHDNAGRQISADRAPVYEWLVALGKQPKIITDGVTELVNDSIVTTVPYHCSREQKSVWLDRGNSLRRQRRSPWLVLHHVPPRTYPGSTGEEREAAELLQTYRPEYFISGHSHQFPYFAGSSWAQRINGVHALVPGQLLAAPIPNHIVLNMESAELTWETSSQEWIPEDGLYDHLVLKFPGG